MTDEERRELEFLRWFYSKADSAMGPASSDIYYMLREEFLDKKGWLPHGYGLDDEE